MGFRPLAGPYDQDSGALLRPGPGKELDLSAAFDTVDHSILMDVLRRRFGIDGSALSWVTKFPSNRILGGIRLTLARLSLITLRFGRCPAGISAWSARLFNTQKTSMTFSSVICNTS